MNSACKPRQKCQATAGSKFTEPGTCLLAEPCKPSHTGSEVILVCGLVKLFPAVSSHLLLNLPATFSKPHTSIISRPSICSLIFFCPLPPSLQLHGSRCRLSETMTASTAAITHPALSRPPFVPRTHTLISISLVYYFMDYVQWIYSL